MFEFVEKVAQFLSPVCFEKVLSCDFLREHPVTLQKHKSIIIVNLAVSTVPLGHYVTCVINRRAKKCILFDPLVIAQDDPNVTDFIDRTLNVHKGMQLIYPQNVFQDSKRSIACGLFALAFTASQSERSTERLKTFLNKFSTSNLVENDKIALNYVLEHIENKCT